MNDMYKIAIFFFLVPLLLRLWGIGDITYFRGDESIHVPAAKNYIEQGHAEPEKWYQPPLRHILLYGSMKICGDNPYGWRVRNVLLGALSVLLLFLVARELFSDSRIAVLAGTFLLFDPLHILFSRSTFGEVTAVFFMLVCLYATLKYIKGNIYALLIAGISIGLALSMKWYYFPATIILLCFALYHKFKDGELGLSIASNIFMSYLLLPTVIYMLSYYPWFGRGYGLTEFFQLQVDAFREQQLLTLSDFNVVIAENSNPWGWYLKPIAYGFQIASENGWARFHIFINNPIIWLLTVPAVLFSVYRSYRIKDRSVFLVVLLCVFTYVQFVIARRPIFLYSSLSVAPFVYLTIAYTLNSILKNVSMSSVYYKAIIITTVSWGLYLYPLVSSRFVPRVLYDPLLSLAKIF